MGRHHRRYWLPEQTHTDVETHRSTSISDKDAVILSATKQSHTVLVSVCLCLSVALHSTFAAIFLAAIAFWAAELIETVQRKRSDHLTVPCECVRTALLTCPFYRILYVHSAFNSRTALISVCRSRLTFCLPLALACCFL